MYPWERATRVGAVAGLAVVVLAGGTADGQEPLTRVVAADARATIGASETEPRDQLDGVVGPRFLRDGSIVVGERRESRIRVYGPTGAHVRDLGGRGPGPGEMPGLGAFTVSGDTILALATDGNRVRYLASGELIDDARRVLPRLTDERFNVVPWAVLSGGRLLVRGNERLFGRADGEHVQRFAVFVLDGSGMSADSLGIHAAQDVAVRDGMPWPYAPPTPLEYAEAMDGTLWIGSGREYRLVRIGAGGRVLAEVVGSPERRALEPADVEVLKERLVERGGTPNDRRVIREWVESLPVAERSPAFRSFFTDREGRLWIEQWARVAAGRTSWAVYDGGGGLLFRVVGPPGLELTDATTDAVVGVAVDEFGRETVRVHGLGGH